MAYGRAADNLVVSRSGGVRLLRHGRVDRSHLAPRLCLAPRTQTAYRSRSIARVDKVVPRCHNPSTVASRGVRASIRALRRQTSANPDRRLVSLKSRCPAASSP
jgi:hypothetical protein